MFGKGGDIDLLLDVYRPPAGVPSKRMAIVHLFGGGFFVGNKNAGYIVNDAKALGARGYTSISANYRLQQEGSWPAQLHDTKAAIRWTRANADRIGVDADRIAVAGYSAGGMLALMAAVTNGKAEFEGNGGNAWREFRRQCLYRRLSARERADRHGAVSRKAGHAREHCRCITDELHLGKLRTDDFHPWHGRHDGADVIEHRLLQQIARALGVPTAMTLIQGANHAFDNKRARRGGTHGAVHRSVF